MTKKERIEYQCWECMGFYSDGKQDCENTRCPLYEYMPYRKMEPEQWFKDLRPRAVGQQKKKEPTPEQRERGRSLQKRKQKRARIAGKGQG